MATSSKEGNLSHAFSSLKVLSHLDRISEMKQGKLVAPVTVELDPTNICNHRCIWCLDEEFQRRCKDTLPEERIFDLIRELGDMGVKGIVVKGSGEPTLVPYFSRLLYAIKDAGMKAALTTNGSLLSGEKAQAVAECCEWVRVSLDAATTETHDRIHRPFKEGEFDSIIANMEKLVRLRDTGNRRLIIGYKFSADENNYTEIVMATRLARDLGVNNVSLRCVDLSCHGLDDKGFLAVEEQILDMMEEAGCYATPDFLVLMGGMRRPAPIESCYASDLVGIVSADGNVYGCLDLKGRPEYSAGSIHEGDFRDIWFGEKRKTMRSRISGLECRRYCSLKYDGYNRILEAVVNPQGIHREFL